MLVCASTRNSVVHCAIKDAAVNTRIAKIIALPIAVSFLSLAFMLGNLIFSFPYQVTVFSGKLFGGNYVVVHYWNLGICE